MYADELEEIEQRTNYTHPGDSLAKAFSDDMVKNAVHSRNIAYGYATAATVALLVSIGGCIYLGSQPKTVPMVFFTDKQGNTWSPGTGQETTMDKATWDAAKQKVFTDFVTDWRSVTSDPVYLQRIAKNVSAHIGENSEASHFIHDWYGQNPVAQRSAKEQVNVDIVSAQPVGSNTYQVQWRERIYTIGMNDPKVESYSAILTYVVEPPKEISGVRANPLGILITQISLTRTANQ